MPGLEQYVGKVLDEKYRLEHLLGQGGMGAVYLAMPIGFALLAIHLAVMARGFVRHRTVLGDGEFDADTAQL